MNQLLNSTIQQLQDEIDVVVSDSSKEQLAQCARLLATYVALYKHQFGELSNMQYADLSAQLAESLEFGESVYSSGLREMLETLLLIEVQESEMEALVPYKRTLN